MKIETEMDFFCLKTIGMVNTIPINNCNKNIFQNIDLFVHIYLHIYKR
jgi:hypothetical protein